MRKFKYTNLTKRKVWDRQKDKKNKREINKERKEEERVAHEWVVEQERRER
jgi:hypothetical protein